MDFSNFTQTLDPGMIAKGVSEKLTAALPNDAADHTGLTPYELGLIAQISVDILLEMLEQYHDFITG